MYEVNTKRVGRIAAVTFVGVAFVAICGPMILTTRARDLAITTTRKVFRQPNRADFNEMVSSGLLTSDAVHSLKAIGVGTGRFQLRKAVVRTCQASGAPCIVNVELEQGRTIYHCSLYIYWGTIVFVMPLPQSGMLLPENRPLRQISS